MSSTASVMDVRTQLVIEAPRDRVWDALITRMPEWWGSPYLLLDDATDLQVQPWVGGLVKEVSPSGEALWGIVATVRPGAEFAFCGGMGMRPGVHGTVSVELSDAEAGTRVRLVHVALGPGAAESTAGYHHGWDDLLTRLAALLERDEPHGIAGSNGPVA